MQILLLIVHILVAVLLIVVILIQRGRGGGLIESFSGVESMFGTKTSAFLTRFTAIFACIFLFTSISLALLAARQSRSLIDEKAISTPQEESERVEHPIDSALSVTQGEQEQVQEDEEMPPGQQESAVE